MLRTAIQHLAFRLIAIIIWSLEINFKFMLTILIYWARIQIPQRKHRSSNRDSKEAFLKVSAEKLSICLCAVVRIQGQKFYVKTAIKNPLKMWHS
jgi:hypothetical protein